VELTVQSAAKVAYDRERAIDAAKRRRTLLEALAPTGRCAVCTQPFPVDLLRIQYAEGATKKPNQCGRWDRVKQYERDHAAGVELRAVCHRCTGRIGAAHARIP
jgi:hypothetical protein